MLVTNKEKLFSVLASGTGTPSSNQPTYLITGGLSSDTLTDANVDYISAASYVIQNLPYTYGGGVDVPCPLNIANGKCYLYSGGIGFAENPPADSIVIATFSSDATKITSWQSVAAFAVNLTVNKLIENDVRLVHTNGALSVIAGQFSWADILYIELPTASAGAATQNTVAAGSVTLAANEIAYVTLNRNTNAVLTVSTDDIGSVDLGPDNLVLAFYDGTQMYLPAFGSNTVAARVDALENKELYYEIFASIPSGTSGTITAPAESTILLDRYPDAGDALAVKAGVDGRPLDEIARQADGTPILATLDVSGNWTINGTPDVYPICLVFQISIELKNSQNVPISSICNIYQTKDASDISYNDSFSGMENVPTVQDAIDKLDIARNYIAAGALAEPVDSFAGDASTVTVAQNDFIVLESGKFVKRTIPESTLPLTDQATNYIVVNVATLQYQNISNVALIDHINYLPVFTIPRTGSFVHQISWDSIGNAPIGRIVDRFVKTRRFERYEGVMLSVNASRNAIISAGKIYYGLTNFSVEAANSATDLTIMCVETSPGVWALSPVTTLNNTQYNGPAGLVNLTANRYAVNFVYRGVENPKHIYYVLGRENATLNQAVASQPPATLPFIISSHAILTGRVIYQNGSNTATQVQSAYDTTFIGAGTVAHADTIGLVDGDAGHTQFAMLAGRSGGQTILGGTIAGEKLTLKSTASSEGGIELLSTATSATDTRIDASLVGTDTNLSLSIATKGNGFFAVNRTGTMGLNSYTIGGQAAGSFAVSIGPGSSCAGASAVAIGSTTAGNADSCVVVGASAGVSSGATGAVSIGQSAACNDIYGVCIGLGRARGQYTRNFAVDGDAYAYGHTTLGIWPTIDTTGSTSSWIATDRILTVGCGTSTSARDDAFYITKNKIAFFAGPISAMSSINLSQAAAGTVAQLVYAVAGKSRWQVFKTNEAETGGDAGSNFAISRFNDAGSVIGTAIAITRSNGLVTIGNDIRALGTYRSADNSAGVSVGTITISGADGTDHYMEFKNGILTFYDTN